MKKALVLILSAVMVLTLASCGEAAENNAIQNELDVPSGTPPNESAPDLINSQDNNIKVGDAPAELEPSESKGEESTSMTDMEQPTSVAQPASIPEPIPVPGENGGEEDGMINISITVSGAVFSAKLYDNDAAKALTAQFPLTLDMSDLNSNEKYYHLADDLPSDSTERPATINAGDIMCWSGNSLVLFYKTFSNSYGGYVRLGYFEDTSDLAAAFGNGDVQVTFVVGD